MQKIYVGVLVVVSSMQINGADLLPRLAHPGASQKLRAGYPRQWDTSYGDIPCIKRDILDDCIAGNSHAYGLMNSFIQTKRAAALQAAATIKRLADQDDTVAIEHKVKLLLDPEKHPCHNLTNAASSIPSAGYPYAKNWIQDGSLNTAIAERYQTLFEALTVFKPTN